MGGPPRRAPQRLRPAAPAAPCPTAGAPRPTVRGARRPGPERYGDGSGTSRSTAALPVYRVEVFRKPLSCTRQVPAGGLGMDTASDAEVPVALVATSCPFGP